ncbi:LysR family transcriptional regulator [Xylophilus rhododendri]|uniref:LysR family transcriptional regulator n=1 Tax=Xylophilus rhododendri TaxID=2697032 RepID=A0A857J3X5_9BURK|nr:LysR family transcriptional regulator [Xylophilus rhododendri]QHI98476.1 LysR family transcriptional regulator [Xylophilus rhododendri]
MKLTSIKGLMAAIEEGSLRSAARRLGISQPALSKLVRELELEMGAPLLMRTTSGVSATAQGRVVYEHSTKALREFEDAAHAVRRLGGDMVGQLHIGAVPLAVMLLVPETLRTFSQSFPEVQIRVSEELYVAQLQRLRSGEVDLMVGGVPADLPRNEFIVEPLMKTTMVPVARIGSAWLSARGLAELQPARWVYTGANAATGYARQWFEREGLTAPRAGAIVNSTLSLLSVVSSTDCVALMPEQIALHPVSRHFISVIRTEERGLDLDIGVITRGDVATRALVRHLISHLHRAAHQARPTGSQD